LQKVELSPYSIVYSVDNGVGEPTAFDYAEAATITADYLALYMDDRFAESSQATLVEFITVPVVETYLPDEPIVVQYMSTAYFSEDTIQVPRVAVLDVVLLDAFSDNQARNGFVIDLRKLPDENPFSTTSFVAFGTADGSSSSRTGAIIGVGAAGLALLLGGGYVIRRNRAGRDEDIYGEDNLNKHAREDDVSTFAGETIAGETYADEYR